MKHINRTWIFLVIVMFGFQSACKSDRRPHWKISDGYIPDAKTATAIADVILVRIYGDDVKDLKPYKVHLVDNKLWLIEGVLASGLDGGVPLIEIQKIDGKILKVTHGK